MKAKSKTLLTLLLISLAFNVGSICGTTKSLGANTYGKGKLVYNGDVIINDAEHELLQENIDSNTDLIYNLDKLDGEIVQGNLIDDYNSNAGDMITVGEMELTRGTWLVYGQVYFAPSSGNAITANIYGAVYDNEGAAGLNAHHALTPNGLSIIEVNDATETIELGAVPWGNSAKVSPVSFFAIRLK